MSLSSWSVFTLGGAIVSINTSTPIVDAGSLELTSGSLSINASQLVPNDDSAGLPHGFTAGRLRSIIRLDGIFGAGTTNNWIGLIAMQSQDDLISGVGDAYGFVWYFTDNGTTFSELRLVKWTSGADNFFTTTLASIPFSPGIGSVFTLEFDFIEAISELGGTFLEGRQGLLPNFSDLSTVLTATDTSSPLTVSVGEGVIHRYQSSSTSNVRSAIFDTTELDSLV